MSQVPGAGRLFTDRAIGSELAGSSLTVSATIHDREAMEAALLAAAARSGAEAREQLDREDPGDGVDGVDDRDVRKGGRRLRDGQRRGEGRHRGGKPVSGWRHHARRTL